MAPYTRAFPAGTDEHTCPELPALSLSIPSLQFRITVMVKALSQVQYGDILIAWGKGQDEAKTANSDSKLQATSSLPKARAGRR